MKQYILLGFYNYYPKGGLNDIQARFKSIDEINFDDLYVDYDNYQVFELDTFRKSELNLRSKMYEVEDKIDIPWNAEELVRLALIKDWLINFLNESR